MKQILQAEVATHPLSGPGPVRVAIGRQLITKWGRRMPSLEPYGDKIASLRRSLGFTQLQLALRAGVSERTVRNAERSRSINREFLQYIAGGLGVAAEELIVPAAEIADYRRWMKNRGGFLSRVELAMIEQDSACLADVVHEDFELHFLGGVPGVESLRSFLGSYYGVDGVKQFMENAQRFWELKPGGSVTLEEPQGDADTVLVRGSHELWRRDGEVVWGKFTYVVDFEDERIRRVVSTMIPSVRPVGVRGILQADYSANNGYATNHK